MARQARRPDGRRPDGRRSGWPLAAVLAEGWNWARAGRATSLGLVILFLLASVSASVADAVAAQAIADGERAWVTAGGLSLAVVGDDGVYAVSSARCEAVSTLRGVETAVAVGRRADPAALTSAPDYQLTVSFAGANLWALLGRTDSPYREAVLTKDVAADLGITDGAVIALRAIPGTAGADLPSRPVRVTVADPAGLDSSFHGVILPTADTFLGQTCVVRARPGAYTSLRLALPGFFPDAGTLRVRDLVDRGGFQRDYAAEWHRRPTRWAWLAIGSVTAAYWLFAGWTRRGQVALLRTLGLDPGGLALLRIVEWGTLALVASVWAATLGFTAAVVLGVDPERALVLVLRTTGASLLLAAALLVPFARRGPSHGAILAALKDR